MRKSTIYGIAVCSLMLAACAHYHGHAPEVIAVQSWGTAKRVVSRDQFYFAGQPDSAGFAQARASGVELVIDLRDPQERDWNEAAVVEAAGLEYHNVVVPSGDDAPFKPERLQRIEQILAANPGRKVLVHCASGSRAAGWYAIHLAAARGFTTQDAIAAAEETGLLKRSGEAAARAYLEATQLEQ